MTVPKLIEMLTSKHVISIASYNEHTVALLNSDANIQKSVLHSSYKSDMRKLINNDEFSDVVFIVEGQAIHAHRAILSARSEHFRAMFASGMRESREETIHLQQLRLPVFLALLEFMYADNVTGNPHIAIELYAAADLYTLDRLKKICEALVHRAINVDNAATFLQAADELNCDRLRHICVSFIVRHFDTVTKTQGFANLSRDLILEILQIR